MTTKKNKQTHVGAPRQSNKHGGGPPCKNLVGMEEHHGGAMGKKLVSISNSGKTST